MSLKINHDYIDLSKFCDVYTFLQKEDELENGIVKTTFETSPPMSTYFVGFVVGELEFVESNTTRGLPVCTVWLVVSVAHLPTVDHCL